MAEEKLHVLLWNFHKAFTGNGRDKEQAALRLYNRIKSIASFRYPNLQDLAAEIADQAIYNIILSFKSIPRDGKPNIWSSPAGDDADKAITDYFYQILRSSKKQTEETETENESYRLFSLVSGICTEFLKAGLLEKDAAGSFRRVGVPAGAEVFQGQVPGKYVQITRKNGDIDSRALEELVLEIFEVYLENFRVPLSKLTELVSDMTGLGNIETISLSGGSDNGEEGDTIIIQVKAEGPETQTELQAEASVYNDMWFSRFIGSFDEDEQELRAAILYLYYERCLTYTDIAEILPRRISKSLVEKYLKDTLKSINFSRELLPGEEKNGYYMKSFLDYLKKIYTPEKYAEGIENE
jgi:hypothetical protein